jgi:peptidoglycan/LPS O-acetylase OafA/YrhL
MSTRSDRFRQLDLLRTLAIALVFAEHLYIFGKFPWAEQGGNYGWMGVDLFFVLSGFLISSQLFKKISLTDFYIRRGLRIWPNYFVILFIYIMVPAFRERGTLPPLWKFFTFTQNFGLNYHEQGAFSHAWSLCVEEQFYIALPFILILLARFGTVRKSVGLAFAIVIGGMVTRYLIWQNSLAPLPLPHTDLFWVSYYKYIYYPTYCRLDGLTTGVGIAAIYKFIPDLWERLTQKANFFLFLGLASLSFAVFLFRDGFTLLPNVIGYPFVSLGFGSILIAGLAPQGYFSKLRVPGMKAGATLAFSIYLTHKQIIHLVRKLLLDAGLSQESVLMPLTIMAACLCASILLYFTIEKPFMALRDHILERRSIHKPIAVPSSVELPI